jgi:chromosome segregation ATPase
MDRLQKVQGDFLAKSNQVVELNEQLLALREAKQHLESIKSSQVHAIEELNTIVKAKEKEAEGCREQLQQESDNMHQQLEKMSEDYANKELQVDELRLEIRKLKVRCNF